VSEQWLVVKVRQTVWEYTDYGSRKAVDGLGSLCAQQCSECIFSIPGQRRMRQSARILEAVIEDARRNTELTNEAIDTIKVLRARQQALSEIKAEYLE
jgi:hypothetical protein